MKNQKGITLIALVITIIVLLILAGVSIAMLTGQNGILTKASGASDKSAVAEVDEAIRLGLAEILANHMDPTFKDTDKDENGVGNKVNADNIKVAVQKNNSNIEKLKDTEFGTSSETDDIVVTYTYKGKSYVWKIGTVETASEGKTVNYGQIIEQPDILKSTSASVENDDSP